MSCSPASALSHLRWSKATPEDRRAVGRFLAEARAAARARAAEAEQLSQSEPLRRISTQPATQE